MSAASRRFDDLGEQLQAAFIERTHGLRARYAQLNARERRIVVVGGVLGLLILIYAGIWSPLAGARGQRVEALAKARAIAQQLELAAALARQSPAAARSTPNLAQNQSLLAAVDQAARSGTLGKAPERLQPEGDREVRVWLEDVPFEALVRWLGELRLRYGITPQSLDVERAEAPGLVSARLSLVRGP